MTSRAAQAPPTQGNLFDPPRPAEVGTHRKADPQTSVDAANRVSVTDRMAEVLAALTPCGDDGAIAHELVALLAEQGVVTQSNIVGRRLADLEEVGLVARTDRRRLGPTHRYQIVWVATPPSPTKETP